MSAALQSLVFAFASVAGAAAIGISLADHRANAALEAQPPALTVPAPVAVVTRLPRVVIEAPRATTLARVGHRTAPVRMQEAS